MDDVSSSWIQPIKNQKVELRLTSDEVKTGAGMRLVQISTGVVYIESERPTRMGLKKEVLI